MTLEIIGISVLWLFLFGYVMVASIDFGAGFFNAYSTLRGKQHILTKIIQRYLSPVWEVTNVFLVFFFVGVVGFSKNGVLLWDNIACSHKHCDYLACHPRSLLCLYHLWKA